MGWVGGGLVNSRRQFGLPAPPKKEGSRPPLTVCSLAEPVRCPFLAFQQVDASGLVPTALITVVLVTPLLSTHNRVHSPLTWLRRPRTECRSTTLPLRAPLISGTRLLQESPSRVRSAPSESRRKRSLHTLSTRPGLTPHDCRPLRRVFTLKDSQPI